MTERLHFTSLHFSGGSDGKEFACQCRRLRFDSWVKKIPWRRAWQPTAVFLPGEFHGQRSLAGYSHWSCKESDMPEQLTHTHSLVVQWLRIHLPMRGRGFDPWSGNIPRAAEQLSHVPQLLKPTCLKPMLRQQEMPPQWEARTLQIENSPWLTTTRQSLRAATKSLCNPMNKLINYNT